MLFSETVEKIKNRNHPILHLFNFALSVVVGIPGTSFGSLFLTIDLASHNYKCNSFFLIYPASVGLFFSLLYLSRLSA